MFTILYKVVVCFLGTSIYFGLKPVLGAETVSWLCILGAFPFAALGFVSYHGMTAEQLLLVLIRSEFLEPKQLVFEPKNLYYEALRETIEKHEKEGSG